ncbi:MAG: hypothetical protein J3R72DRAFT_17586 [Linnemannia gamsii]|nr:MAG: hypothetical protein J3R72DRAFT_17586 [Linnemannia gamsii]
MWRRRKNDLTATRYRCALLPCNKVFAIPELLDLIMFFVHAHGVSKRLKYGFVCHHWKSFFAPYIWEDVDVYGKDSLLKLRLHGPRVKSLTCYQVDQPLFDTLLQYVYNVECAYHFLNSHSIWITYRHFEHVFEAQQDQLTRLVLTVDFYTIDPRMLWALFRLKLLNDLFLYVRKATDLAMVCIQALQCCPALTTFRVTSRESFFERRGRWRNVGLLKTRIQRAVM